MFTLIHDFACENEHVTMGSGAERKTDLFLRKVEADLFPNENTQ
jgi:hypothetical protein